MEWAKERNCLLIASQDCHCLPVQNHHLISIKYFRDFKMKSIPHIHKSQLQHPHVWYVFCQQRWAFKALALLYTTHGHTSVFSFQFSSFLQHFCCDTSAVWHLLTFVTQDNTCPNSPAMTNLTELFFSDVLPGDSACFPSALTGINFFIDIHS